MGAPIRRCAPVLLLGLYCRVGLEMSKILDDWLKDYGASLGLAVYEGDASRLVAKALLELVKRLNQDESPSSSDQQKAAERMIQEKLREKL